MSVFDATKTVGKLSVAALQRFWLRRKWIHIESVMSRFSFQVAKELGENLYGTVFRKILYTLPTLENLRKNKP